MQITHLEVSNFLRVEQFKGMMAPLVIVAAPNGRGKSSLCDAIAFALTGDLGRVENKKHMGQLLHRGTESGAVTVQLKSGDVSLTVSRDVATGKLLTPESAMPAALPYVLRGQGFAELTPAERRTFLYNLMGVSLGTDEIIKRLEARGVDSGSIGTVSHLFAAGFAPALAQAEKAARDAKSRWHEVTGENYGHKKAEGWKAEAESYDEKERAEIQEDIAGWNVEIARLNQLIGEARTYERERASIPALEVKAKGHAAFTAQRNDLQRRLGTLETELAGLSGETQGKPAGKAQQPSLNVPEAQGEPSGATLGWECPECHVPLFVKAGKLVVVPKPSKAPKASKAPAPPPEQVEIEDKSVAIAARRRELTTAIADVKSALHEAERKVGDADTAARDLQRIEEAVISEDVAEAPAKLIEAQEAMAVCQADSETMEVKVRQATEAGKKTERAMDLHRSAQRWEVLAEALGPDGVPADILKDALGPLDAQLAMAADDTGWARVTIDADMAVTADGFSYLQLGESHRYRCDAMLAVSIAILSGIRLVTLDRWDCLDLEGRSDCLSWLYDLIKRKDLHSCLLFATLKAPMNLNRPLTDCYWLGDKEEVAA